MRSPRPLALLAAAAVIVSACGASDAGPSPSASASARPSESGTPGNSPVETGSGSAGATPSVSPSPSVPSGTYTVQPGDTLYSIAVRFGVTVEELQAWNAERYPSLVTNPESLQPGWVLIVAGEPGATPPGEPQPTSAPPPSAAGCNAGYRVGAGGQEVFRTIPGTNAGAGSAGVALTFDMGGRIEPAVAIMEFLVANEVCATIFPTGVMSQTPEGAQVLQLIRQHPELFEVANHTMHHCNLRDGGGGSPTTGPCPTTRPSDAFIGEELTDAEAILRAGTAQTPQPYWRPPYGAYDQGVLNAAAAVGYTKTFMWDIDTLDWNPVSEGGPTAQQICSNVVNNAVGGSNVLMHLGGWNTLDALPCMVTGLRERGFVVTSLSDLLQ